MSAVTAGMATGARGAGKVLKNVPPNRAAAVMAWFFSAFTTSTLIESFRGSTYNSPYELTGLGTLNWMVTLVFSGYFMSAIFLQIMLTLAESPIWRKQPATSVSVTALVIDSLVNASAVYPFIRNLDKTPIWYMITDATGAFTTYHLLAALALSGYLGYVMAGAPEKLWSGT